MNMLKVGDILLNLGNVAYMVVEPYGKDKPGHVGVVMVGGREHTEYDLILDGECVDALLRYLLRYGVIDVADF